MKSKNTIRCFLKKKLPPVSQTLGFDESQQITISHREKTDYFYLPEVNIPPIRLKTSEIQKVKKNLPKLPWIYWEELKNFDLKTANEVIKNYDLLKTFKILEKKGKFKIKEGKNWATFYLNYLSPHFGNNSSELFAKKWKSYCSLLQHWKEKKLENEEINEIINSLIKSKKTLNSLIKKYEKKSTTDNQIVEKELEILWNDELAKTLVINHQKVQNYLLGQLKKSLTNYHLKELVLIINNFLTKKINNK